MNLKTFSRHNASRSSSPEGFNHKLDSWSIAEWTNALCGEAGEAANVAKKMIRHRDNVSGNMKAEDKDVDKLRERLASEIADVIIYADLTMQALGLDTASVLRDTFNAKSEKMGYKHLIPED